MELSRKKYDKQFTTVTTHKNVQNYYNEKCAKYLMFALKKYRGVIFHDTEGWRIWWIFAEEGYKIWKGIDSSFQNWYNEFDKFWPEHSKVSKIFNLMGSLWAKYILF